MSEFPNSAHQVIEQADPTDPHPEATLCPRSTTVATPPIHIAEHFTTLENVRNGLEIGRKVWEDPVFPASDATLFYIKKRPDYLPPRVDWKRPTELSKRPQMVTMGVTRFDVLQGSLGDCWFLAPLTALTTNLASSPELLERSIVSTPRRATSEPSRSNFLSRASGGRWWSMTDCPQSTANSSY